MAVLRAKQIESVKPQVPEIGRIFKGAPKRQNKNGKMIFGEDLDHFRFEPDERTKTLPHGAGKLYDHLKRQWAALDGETGGWRSLPIRFPFSRLEDVFSYSNEVWANVGGKEVCVRRCNGSVVSKYSSENAEGKKVIVNGALPCAMSDEDAECPSGCKATGRLRFMIPALGYPGMLMLTTHSGKDIREILANLLPYQHMDLASIPFRLFRSYDDCDRRAPDGSIQRQKKWLMHLEIDAEFGMLAIEGRERRYRAELSGQPVQALPVREVAIAALPSADPELEWVRFMARTAAIAQGRSSEQLMEVVEDALNTLPESMHYQIHAEQERVSALMAEDFSPAQPQVQPETPALDRLKKIRQLTGHSTGQVKAIAQSMGLDVTQAPTWSDETIEQFRDALYLEYGNQQGCFNHANHSSAALAKLKATGQSDIQLWELWFSDVVRRVDETAKTVDVAVV